MVDEIKNKTAELIDLCDRVRSLYVMNHSGLEVGEVTRLTSLAQTHYEDAAMWAVKAATA